MLSININDVRFISDTHIGHQNIIKYCNRPFSCVADMDNEIWKHLFTADAQNKCIVHLGDFLFFNDGEIPILSNRSNHVLILGNHDKNIQNYENVFGIILGHRKQWKSYFAVLEVIETNLHSDLGVNVVVNKHRIMLSHEPQRNLGDCDYNFYGHHHNNMFRDPHYFLKEYDWLFDSHRHINVSAELTDYKPISFHDALKLPKLQRPI